MKMLKIICISAAILLWQGYLQAEEPIKPINAPLKEATVFFHGAELIHSMDVSLQKGENAIVAEGLSPVVDNRSISISITNGVLVSSYEFTVNYLWASTIESHLTAKLKDSVNYYTDLIQKTNTSISINKELLAILKKGTEKTVSGSEKGVGVDELTKNIDYFQNKSLALEASIYADNRKIKDCQIALSRLNNQLRQEASKNTTSSGVLKLNLNAPITTNATLTIKYFTSTAKWIPYYDINVVSTDKPVKFTTKSKVSQTTGLDWNKVKLTLSTARPSFGKVAPVFSAWFLNYYQPAYSKSRADAIMNSLTHADYTNDMEMETVMDEKKAMATGSVSTVFSDPPLYFIDEFEATQQDFDNMDISMIKDRIYLSKEEAMAKYGNRASGGAIIITTKKMEDYITQSDNVLNQTFAIELPYFIPGNGKAQTIELGTKESTAIFKYYAAPKLDPATYLLAEIPDWEKLALFSGDANITYEGTFVGATFINTGSTDKTLALTLGINPRVVVKRVKEKEFTSMKMVGNDNKVALGYTITVKNTQNKVISFVLKEQYPISSRKEIDVQMSDENIVPSPTLNRKELGVITWETDLQAGESKVFKISYSIKYPKDKQISLE
ncbi:MAG: DUF4139 domain-containing protein [Bacteroidales bacterium]|jgi:hypothetical protein|nr:DUF4139 domain-containing protein [Bacteroidales bacterium]